MFAAVSPVYGIMIGMAVYFLPLIVGAALAEITTVSIEVRKSRNFGT
jgi:hypothetical protein